MTSNIDPTVPVYGAPTTASVRDNFAIAKSEITALQNTASVPGPAGPAGAPGAPGAPGAAGPPGATGPAGTYQTGPGLHINSGTTPPTIDVATPYLALSGGTLSGALTLSGNATANLQPVSLQQLNSTLSPYATTSAVAATYAPLANPVFTGAPQVPTASTGANSTQAASTQFVQTTVATGPSANNVGRNLLHNAYFNVQQRGAGPWTTTASMTADRWRIGFVGGTMNVTLYAANDSNRASIGDEACTNILSYSVNGTAGAGDYAELTQNIEDVHRLAGKTVTVSFYAVGSAAGVRVGVSLDQLFGIGGSTAVSLNGQSFATTTGFVRYSATFTLPSIAGKTLGTNGDHTTQLNIWFSAGANQAARSGNVGVQTGVSVTLWGVQLEIGSTVTPLERIDPGEDLRRCMRFYQVYPGVTCSGYGVAGGAIYGDFSYAVPMRAAPSVTFANYNNFNASNATVTNARNSHLIVNSVIAATGSGYSAFDAILSADL